MISRAEIQPDLAVQGREPPLRAVDDHEAVPQALGNCALCNHIMTSRHVRESRTESVGTLIPLKSTQLTQRHARDRRVHRSVSSEQGTRNKYSARKLCCMD